MKKTVMNLAPASAIVKSALAGHSWIGLVAGGLTYLICLSGTLAVFYQELERWEQPSVEERTGYEPAAVEKALENLAARVPELPEHVYVTLPSPAMPRLIVSTDREGWFVDRDGLLGEAAAHDWTHLLLNLHIYLHLPSTVGLVLVSSLGALLFGLIASGFLAHPSIFKDAFSLRILGSRQLEQTDIHNRLSVWGAPFHVVIALTGAYFGLVSPLLSVVASAYHRGDERAVSASVFGDEPALDQKVAPPEIARALRNLETVAPQGTPILVTLHGPGTPRQFIEVFATHPGRLIYSENYRFDTRGVYLGKAGFSDGELGRQIVYSSYRAHFGHFGGFPVKVAYAVLGLALTVVSVTGVNIWLARRKARDYLDDLWAGLVLGRPRRSRFDGCDRGPDRSTLDTPLLASARRVGGVGPSEARRGEERPRTPRRVGAAPERAPRRIPAQVRYRGAEPRRFRSERRPACSGAHHGRPREERAPLRRKRYPGCPGKERRLTRLSISS